MRRFLLTVSMAASVAVLPIISSAAYADVILAFGQSGGGNTITGTESGGSTTVTTDQLVTITSYAGSETTPFDAYLDLTMASTGAATQSINGSITTDQQAFSGSFTLTSQAGGAGTNFLSGTFTGLLSGSDGGSALSFGTSGTPSFTSSLIASADLQAPTAISFGFTNVTPAVSISDDSLGSFASSVSGNMSSSYVAPLSNVPEPASLLLLGSGVIGFAAIRRRPRSTMCRGQSA